MALGTINIATTDEASIDYEVISTSGTQAVRSDSSKSASTPRLLEISHQPGNQKTPDRHLIRFTDTRQSSTDESVFQTCSAHLVLTAPRTVTTSAELKELVYKLKAYCTSANLDAILRGGLG